MEYETGNRLPREPAIKLRNIDIYGFGNEYFDAYCHYRNAQRTFKISRVLSAQLCDQSYQIPHDYVPSGWVTEGWGEIKDATLEQPVEIAPSSIPYSPTKRGRQPSREVGKYRQGSEVAKSYVRYDWQRIFEESIKTPFLDELSPALPYLHKAYRLEKEGAAQHEVQEMIEKARAADSSTTNAYLVRRSIMRKMQNQSELE